jgi:hypothetical protein
MDMLDEIFYGSLKDAANLCLEARRCIAQAVDAAPEGTNVAELVKAWETMDQWAEWLNPPSEGGYGGPNVVRFPIERRG